MTCSRNPFGYLLSEMQGIFPCVGYIDLVSFQAKYVDSFTRATPFFGTIADTAFFLGTQVTWHIIVLENDWAQ